MTVLVVEDEKGLKEAIIHELRSEGYIADGASDGDEGLARIETGTYDIVILDIMLPKRSGLDILRTIRSAGNPVPVLLLTALSDVEDKVTGIDCGADDYLTKPFAFPELLARIRMITRRQMGLSAVDSNLHVGDLTLDTARRELLSEQNGRRVKLGSKEYELLEYLMRHAGQVLSRDQITDRIWGHAADVEYNNVDVYISFLRKKLRFVGSSSEIQAVRGVGYILQIDREPTQ